MFGKIWMLTPVLALATVGALSFVPASDELAKADISNCVKVAHADTGVMSDAAPDACVYSVQAVAPADGACPIQAKARARAVTAARAMPVVRIREMRRAGEPEHPLEWPGDFIALTAGAAVAVWETTVGVLGDLYDYAADSADDLWI